MIWYNLGLLALLVALAFTVAFSPFERLWRRVRFVPILGFKIAGVLVGTWLLITYAERTSTGFLSGASSQLVEGRALAMTVLGAAETSLVLMLVASAFGTVFGLGIAYLLVTPSSRGRLGAIALAATAVWVVPTFLIAALVQELQAQIYGASGIGVSGGYGSASVVSAAWAGLVLAMRPAAYIFRQSRLALDEERTMDHVRAAAARGFSWRRIVNRHIVRPAGPTLTANWVAGFRIMIGSLPLVEFFFAYPGLGMQLVLALGIAYPDQPGHFQPDLAIGLIAAMAGILMTLEIAGRAVQELLDPRLRELRAAPA
jgi:ABC-type dipeptide/oligopeptide/nickel transport system permease component